MRVLLVGGTGTIGQATAGALEVAGHELVCFGRRGPPGAEFRAGDVTDTASVLTAGFRGQHFDAVVSCLASRTGVPTDAWAIDHGANLAVLEAAQRAGVPNFVLLSAICVQKPTLAFQRAKLAFEAALTGSGMRYSIVRPTAYFKSLSGQVGRLRRGKPFLMFGDGQRTACKPISDGDLARYLVACLDDPALWDRVLPIGGPGPAITPQAMGERLFALLGMTPRFRSVPIRLLDVIVATLGTLRLREKAELARIGRYYATESMLVLDPITQKYSAAATPETGADTLFDFYARLIDSTVTVDRREHAVF
ncbi:MAG: NAD(P)H-binding protein [Janthinobacterium lividum]